MRNLEAVLLSALEENEDSSKDLETRISVIWERFTTLFKHFDATSFVVFKDVISFRSNDVEVICKIETFNIKQFNPNATYEETVFEELVRDESDIKFTRYNDVIVHLNSKPEKITTYYPENEKYYEALMKYYFFKNKGLILKILANITKFYVSNMQDIHSQIKRQILHEMNQHFVDFSVKNSTFKIGIEDVVNYYNEMLVKSIQDE